jgi:hypothetical protein
MTNPHAQIESVIHELSVIEASIATAAYDAAIAEADFKSAFAQARLMHRAGDWKSKPTEALIEDYATVDTEDERRKYLIANALLDAKRQSLRALMARLDGLRTLVASTRSL